ncbi:MAG: MFS transporter [Gammaproteobacteria bacterium]|nr:MAG: MFS transporter [Gammaproteobacteria bacterium]
MMADQIQVGEVIDRSRMGAQQWWVMLFCTLVVVLDGFDVQAIAFTAPQIGAELGIATHKFGTLFSAGLIGMAIGALLIGPVGDRLGRKLAIIGSLFAFGLFTLATAWASSYEQLLVLRLLTGLGLGGALPNATALMSEYANRAWRNVAISIIFLGIPIGGIVGSLVAGKLMPIWGWQSVYVVGGVLPLITAVLLIWMMPESIRYLATRRGRNEQIAKTLNRINPAGDYRAEQTFEVEQASTDSGPIGQLFAPGYGRDTLLLWAAFFTNLIVVYFLISWTPTLFSTLSDEPGQGVKGALILNLGGAVGPLLLAWLTSRYGSKRMLPIVFVLGAIVIIGIGQVGDSINLVTVGIFLAGFLTFGAQIGMNALAASIYPTASRATGVGWALGIGRWGSILGPVIGGILLARNLGMPVYFTFFGSILLLSALAIGLLDRHQQSMERS